MILEDATVRRVSETIRQMLERIGDSAEVHDGPWRLADFYARLREHPQAFISKWFWPEPVDAIIGFIASWGRDGGPNFQGSSNAAIDSACHAWEIATTDAAQRVAAAELQRLAVEEVPLIPLFSPAAVWAHHSRVRNWRPNRHDLYPLYGEVWLADG